MTKATAQPTEAAEAEVRTYEDAFNDFADAALGANEEEDEEESTDGDEPEDDALDGDDPEGDDSPDEGDEPEQPAIDPPVSWGTDAKELFAQLPADLQKQVVEREAQRERFVQQKAGEAAEAKRIAQVEATNALAETQRQYASELEQYAQLFTPQQPDPRLLQTGNPQDAAAFYQLQAQYEQGKAQHQQMMQQAQHARYEAEQREQAARAQATEAELTILAQAVPDWNDDAKRQAFITDVTRVGQELGYTPDILNQATAQDVLALKKALEWKSQADKWQALQKKKMEAVRAAKKLPKVSKPGVAQTNGELAQNRSQAAWQRVKTARTDHDKADAFADFMGL